MKELLVACAIVVALAGGLLARFVMRYGPRNAWGRLRYDRRSRGSLRVGDVAPDAILTSLDGVRQVALRERFGARPVVLVFGSYT